MFIKGWKLSTGRAAARLCLALLSVLAGGWAAPADAQDPVKLEVVSSARAVGVGAAVTLEVTLRAADNSVAKAPKPMEVQFDVAAPFGQSALGSVSFAPGQSSVQIPLQVTAPGMWSVRALNKELLEGGAIILGKPPKEQGALPAEEPQEVAAAEPLAPGDDADPLTRGLDDVIAPGGGVPAAEEPPVDVNVNVAVALPTAPPRAVGWIRLAATPERRFLANGKDAATITVILEDAPDGAVQDIQIQFLPSLGTVSPNPLIIPKGEVVAFATLTAAEVGKSKVRIASVRPRLEVGRGPELEVSFAPPISQIQVSASPPDSSLLDVPEIVVALKDADGQTVATDEPRTVALRLEEGNGEVQPVQVEIAAGKFEGRAKFMPWWMGATRVVAVTPNLIERTATLNVMLPTLLIALTAAGGLVGGIIAFWTNRSRWWRVVIGAFAGFVLYWAMIFGLLQSVPRNVALNPLSAFAVALIGGYVGPQLLGMLAKKFGITIGK